MILTSGTTGTPKGAPRKEAGIPAAVSLLSRMPLHFGWRTHIAAPLFHTWGFAHFALAMLLGSTVVLRRRFDPEDVLRVVEEHRCESLVVIPVMLQRILGLDDAVLVALLAADPEGGGVVRLRAAGRARADLDGPVRRQPLQHLRLDRGGVGDHRDARGPARGALLGRQAAAQHDRAPLRRGRPARAARRHRDGSSSATACCSRATPAAAPRPMIDGLMSSGDVGRFDEDGRLYVEGRDDEMIVSGGENVFPKEIEDCLVGHASVVEAAAVGIDDPEFGTRLRAFVARQRRGHRGRAEGPRQGQPGAVQGAQGDRLHPRAAPQRHRQDPQARARVVGRGQAVTGLQLGGPAPDFTLRDQFGQDVTLSSYRGTKAVVILFYPYAFSGVCTGEMAGIRERLDEFMTFDTEVLAHLLRPGLLAAGLRRRRGAQLPAAVGLLAARRGVEVRSRCSTTSRGRRAGRRTSSTARACCAWAVHNANPEGRDLDEHLAQLRGALV